MMKKFRKKPGETKMWTNIMFDITTQKMTKKEIEDAFDNALHETTKQ